MAGAVLRAGVVVGLAVPASAVAQPPTRPTPPPTDTTRRDPVRVTVPAAGQPVDSGRAARIDSVQGVRDTLPTRVRRDSIQAPIAHAELPTLIGVGPLYRWNRDSVYTTGAVNLTDILSRVPGVTIFRSGFLASAQTAAYLGDPSRVRVFRDGVELDVVDPRASGVIDLAEVQLANVGEIVVERVAGEIRVHVRTWSGRSTTPYTRVDAFTGDEDTNLYRFFFGRRFGSGFDAQAGVQQFGTGSRNRRTGGGGSVLEALGRFGWARGRWSADLVYSRLDRQRDVTTTFFAQDSILPPVDSRRTEAYARVAYGDPDSSGAWVQGIANTLSFSLAGTSQTVLLDSAGRVTLLPARARDTLIVADSSASRVQYVLTGGYTLGPVRISGTDRVRAFRGSTYHSPSARASFANSLVSLSAFAERNAVRGDRFDIDTTDGSGVRRPVYRASRIDVSARVSPLSWVAVLADVSRESDTSLDSAASSASTTTTRLEAAVRVGRMWISAGVVRRAADTLLAPRVYECLTDGSDEVTTCAQPATVGDLAATGTVFGARGRYYKDVYVDLVGTVWKSGGAYRPQYQLRAETGVETRWLRRFPSGNFGFKAAIIDEYRSRTYFPTVGDNLEGGTPLFAPPTNVLGAQVDIRIQTGTLSYQLRNALGRRYEFVPGLRMPGPISYYGVRWTFFN